MTRTATAVKQTAWECKWSRPGFRLAGLGEDLQPETAWVCVRKGEREAVTDERCDQCPHWEADDFRRN